jgi:Adenylate and Guanylate cyclase catalytic domain/zinc-ribbon domain
VDPHGQVGGALAAARLSCGSCGTELPPNAKFCNECGAAVAQVSRAAEYKQVTVLFADVVRSMDIAATLDIERLRDVMTELLERSAAVARRYGGTVEHTGEGVMAIFGAPIALEDHAFRACVAALGIQEETSRLTSDVQERDGVDLHVRVGLNSGRVIAGDIGSGRWDTGRLLAIVSRDGAIGFQQRFVGHRALLPGPCLGGTVSGRLRSRRTCGARPHPQTGARGRIRRRMPAALNCQSRNSIESGRSTREDGALVVTCTPKRPRKHSHDAYREEIPHQITGYVTVGSPSNTRLWRSIAVSRRRVRTSRIRSRCVRSSALDNCLCVDIHWVCSSPTPAR